MPEYYIGLMSGTSIDGIDAAERVPGVQEVSITAPLGRHIDPLPRGNRYLGFIFALADSPETVEQALRDAHSCLEIRIAVGVAENGDRPHEAEARWEDEGGTVK